MPPQPDGIVHVSPSTKRFQFKYMNTFWITGSGLEGADLADLWGSIEAPNRPVIWTDFGVLDNTDDSQLLVYGTPWKGHRRRLEIVAEMDSGDVTPTVTNDGSMITNSFPSDYST